MSRYVERVIDMLPKLSSEEVKRVLMEVVSENSMLDSLIESFSTGLILVDKKWRILQVNKAAKRILRISSDEEKYEDELLFNVIEENEEISDWLKNIADTHRTNVREEFSSSSSSDGSVRFLAVSVFSFVQKTEISGSIVKIEDITQQKAKAVLDRRLENMEGLTNLAAGMAHEIKNPLGAISIHIQLVQKAISKKRGGDGTLPDKKFLEEHLDIVNDEIEKLNDLVMDFLFAVRPVNAKLTLSDPEEILSSICDFVSPEFNKSHVLLKMELLKEKKRIMIDEKLFRQVIINIAQNAFYAVKAKFPGCTEENTNSQEMPGIVIFKTTIIEDNFVISISDNGIGMDSETVGRIFEPYFTTKANGTGLGMTMSYKIIKEFGGDIQVKSEKGTGSVFFISLPVPQTETKLLG